MITTTIKTTVSFLMIVVLQACGDNKSDNKIPAAVTEEVKQKISSDNTAKVENNAAGFKINGIQAIAGTRSDEQPGAQMNAMNDNLTIVLYGDIVQGTKRGMLSLISRPFEKKVGEVINARATYTRYLDDHGGKILVYGSNKEGTISLNLSKCEQLPNGPIGEEWLLSGTFSGKLPVSVLYEKEATDKTLDFTEGKFDNIKLIVLGKKK